MPTVLLYLVTGLVLVLAALCYYEISEDAGTRIFSRILGWAGNLTFCYGVFSFFTL